MAAVLYPTTLPGPSKWGGVPFERRAVSSLPGNTQHRHRSRDALQDIEAQWNYTAAEMAIWRAWYEDMLLDGQLWFAKTAPGAGGWIPRVFKHRTKTLKREALANGNFRVSAQLQQRGLGAAPRSDDTYLVNVDAITNAAGTSVNGVTLSGLDASATYTLSMPPGQLYTAYSQNAGASYGHYFWVTTSGGSDDYGLLTAYGSAEAARAAFPGATLTGYSSYTFWINDVITSDNSGGLSIQVVG